MGNFTKALGRACEGHGAEVRLRSGVKRILVQQGRAVGVELPEFTGNLACVNGDSTRWLMAYYNSVDHLDRSWGDCKRGRLPADPMSAYYIPSI